MFIFALKISLRAKIIPNPSFLIFMATNTFRNQAAPQKPSKAKAGDFFERLNNWLNPHLDLGDELPTSTLKKIIWVSGLVIFYIYLQHNYESLIRQIEKSKAEMEDRRAAYISQKSAYMYAGKQSEIAKKLNEQGLEESITPPNKILVDTNE